MREKNLRISLLLDFYGELLGENKRRAVEMYYNEDLSLAEIADATGITRQGVRDCIEKAKAQLLFYEEKLGLAAKMSEINSILSAVTPKLEELKADLPKEQKSKIDEVIAAVGSINI